MNVYLVQFNQFLETLRSAPNTSTTPSGTTRPPCTSLPTHGSSLPTQDTYQPSDVAQNVDSFYEPLGGGSHSVPVDPSLAVDPSDTMRGSSPSRPDTLSNRRNASRNAENPPAKRSRRPLRPKAKGNTNTKVNPKDESLGFLSLNQQPERQKALRALVVAIRDSGFFRDNL